MRSTRWLVLVAALVLVGAGCGDDGDSGGPVTLQRCTDLVVEAFNGLDIGDVQVSDGLDEGERSALSDQLADFENDNPETRSDGECDNVFSDASAEEQQSFVSDIQDRIDPERIELLDEL
ncbi:MAG: hypothetical protein ACT4PW_12335 [Acidimicrobiia bacterium]